MKIKEKIKKRKNKNKQAKKNIIIQMKKKKIYERKV